MTTLPPAAPEEDPQLLARARSALVTGLSLAELAALSESAPDELRAMVAAAKQMQLERDERLAAMIGTAVVTALAIAPASSPALAELGPDLGDPIVVPPPRLVGGDAVDLLAQAAERAVGGEG